MLASFDHADINDRHPLLKIFFILQTVLTIVIMLNLIIAIILDTYQKCIVNMEDNEDLRAQNDIILQLENVIIWRRLSKQHDNMHLFWMRYEDDDIEDLEYQTSEIAAIGNNVDKIMNCMEKLTSQVEMLKEN